MNKFWKFAGIFGVVAGVVATSILIGKETTEEDCNEIERQVEETLGGQENE